MPGSAHSGYRLRVADPSALAVNVVLNPQISLARLLIDSVARRASRPLDPLLHRVRTSLRPHAAFALAPFAGRTLTRVPCSLAPVLPATDVPVATQFERMLDMPDADIRADLRAAFGEVLPEWWYPADAQPHRWMRSFAAASGDAWTGAVDQVWTEGKAVLEREIRRVGTAVVRGQFAALLNSLHPRVHYLDGQLRLDTRCDLIFDAGPRPVSLEPMLAGPDALFVDFENPELISIAYPVSGPSGAGTPAGARGEDALSLVLGALRAHVLRRAGVPITVGRLAGDIQCASNTVSYHCTQLEQAGLLLRERRGQSVWLHRTARGDELVELLAG